MGAGINLMDALADLDLDFRTVIAACDIVGMSMDETAALLDLPAGTVKSRLHRARAQLARSSTRSARRERSPSTPTSPAVSATRARPPLPPTCGPR